MPFFGTEEPQAGQPSTSRATSEVRRCAVTIRPFIVAQAQLPGRLATMFNIEWTAPICDCVVCSQCGYVHWFFPMKE